MTTTDLHTAQCPDADRAHRSNPLISFVQGPLGAYLGVARVAEGVRFSYGEGVDSFDCTIRDADLGACFLGGAKAAPAEALLGLLCLVPVETEFCRGYGQAYVVLKWPLARGSFEVEVPWIELELE